jgi:quercetin dioxygenase-like cupin family protein
MKRILIAVSLATLIVPALVRAGDPPATSKAGETAAPASQVAPSTPAPDAAATTATTPAVEHRIFTSADMKWSEGPPSLPKGVKVAVLEGDLAAPGPFTMRVMAPAGYKIPPHWHPGIEHVTVISGALYMGLGETWDESKGHELSPGSFAYMQAGTKHFAWTKKVTVLQVHGVGPWGITYINPSDDPRNQKQATK